MRYKIIVSNGRKIIDRMSFSYYEEAMEQLNYVLKLYNQSNRLYSSQFKVEFLDTKPTGHRSFTVD